MGEYDTVTWDLVQHNPVPPLRIWIDAGRYEWLLDCNQGMHRLLVKKGCEVVYRQHNGGHSYTSWRNDLWRGLEWLLGREKEMAG